MISIHQVKKLFKGKDREVVALHGVDLEVKEGEFFVLLGPSGSGKTTLLRCVAGLETPDEGDIYLAERLVSSSSQRIHVPAEQRATGMVFQSYAIWPHLDVFWNVALPLTRGRRKIPKSMVQERVRRALTMVGIEGLEARPASLLSGGQQQRVALARALAIEPTILLMDEPLSNLDARLREEVRKEIKALVQRVGVTVLYVTHDQIEAMELADRAAVMHDGSILQVGSAEELYTFPAEPKVGQFFGSMNWIRGKWRAEGVVETQLGAIHVSKATIVSSGEGVLLAVRPEMVELINAPRANGPEENVFPCEIVSDTFLGGQRVYTVKVCHATLVAMGLSSARYKGSAYVRIPKSSVRVFPEQAGVSVS
jgi:iron(III) transport system ATP-binding protein